MCVERGTLNEGGRWDAGSRGRAGFCGVACPPFADTPKRSHAPGRLHVEGSSNERGSVDSDCRGNAENAWENGEWARRGIEFLALPNGVNRPMSLRCDCRTPNGCKGTPGSVQCVWAWTNGSRQLGVGGRQTVALRPRTPTPPLPLFPLSPILPLSHAHTPKPPDVPRPKPDTNAHSPGESPNPPQVRSIRFAVSYPTIGRTQPVHITIR